MTKQFSVTFVNIGFTLNAITSVLLIIIFFKALVILGIIIYVPNKFNDISKKQQNFFMSMDNLSNANDNKIDRKQV